MIPIIDLFAGPGGLSEGFSAYNAPFKRFKTFVSVEMDAVAHKTLLLRSFCRQFDYGDIPDDYYAFIKQPFSLEALNLLLDRFEQGSVARSEALCLELGADNDKIFSHIESVFSEHYEQGRPCVLLGGPPCQAYSLAGRSRNKGKILKNTEDEFWCLENDPRSRLYFEYLKVLARFQPAVFVMENVKGLLSAKLGSDRVIDLIMSDLKNPNTVNGLGVKPITRQRYSYKLFSLTVKHDEDVPYEPADFVIRCEDYGIPQRRHRVIIMGIREDYAGAEFNLLRTVNRIPVKNAIDDLPACFSQISARENNLSNFDIELSRHDNVPKMILEYFTDNQVAKGYLKKVLSEYVKKVGIIRRGHKNKVFDPDWFICNKLNGYFCNHEPRTHMRSDFLRYFFVACFGKAFLSSPKLEDFPEVLLPDHNNVGSDKFVDRFKVQIGDIPSTTITCHISKDGHYYIHPDPRQCRSLTVREAARLQTFPDDYFFCGNKTQQYHQVGNAVPPLLAMQIAEIVYQILEPYND